MESRQPLTALAVKRLAPRPAAYSVPAGELRRFAIRIYPSSSRSWIITYRSRAGIARRFVLGDANATTLAQARVRAREVLARVDAGVDVFAEERAAKARAELSAPTMAAAAAAFISDQSAHWRPATRAAWTRYINAEILPRLGSKRPEQVSATDVAELRERLAATAPASADRCVTVLRRLLAWLTTTDPSVALVRSRAGLARLAVSPCATGTSFRRQPKTASAARQAFSDAQLRAILTAARGSEIEEVVWLGALTATRQHDVRSARRGDFDLGRRVWRIPTAKTGHEHVVPLSQAAAAVVVGALERNLARGYSGEWLFPSDPPMKCEVCLAVGHRGKDSRALLMLKAATGIETRGLLHRLRHSFRTRASEHGIANDVAELVLAHRRQGIAAVYNAAELLPQRAAALAWWAEELARIVGGEADTLGGGRVSG